MAGQRKELPVEIINLGEADGLPPVDWAAVVDKLEYRARRRLQTR